MCVYCSAFIWVHSACYTGSRAEWDSRSDRKLHVTDDCICSVDLFCFFSRPWYEDWPHHGRTFSIYLCPLSFWLTLPRGVLSMSWCCPSRRGLPRLRAPSLVIALLYSLCIHKIGLRISVHNFLSDLVTACNKSWQKTRVTNLLSKALQDNMHEMIDNN